VVASSIDTALLHEDAALAPACSEIHMASLLMVAGVFKNICLVFYGGCLWVDIF
jgi:hypothetical protein